MRNEIQDKQYLALELTKICYGNKGEEYADDIIYETYENNLKKLTNTVDEINTITTLKNEINKFQKENERLKTNNRVDFEPLFKDLLKALEDCKGDMEPYVYDTFKNVFISKIQ